MNQLFILFIGVFLQVSDLYVEDYSPKMLIKAEKQVEKYFKKNTSLIGFTPEQFNALATNSSFFYIKNTQQKILGIAVITRANGCVMGGCSISNASETRFEQFDLLIIYNKEKELNSLVVLDYPGEYGFEISAKWWLKQFIGKTSVKHNYRKDIDAISGATVSAQSVVNEVNTLNLLINKLVIIE